MDGMQVPVPPGTKTGYSRASTRPTSATTACSDSPRSRPQRPLSARSTGSRDARNSACYEADFATNSWSDWQSAPSRPTSAKSQAGQVASTPQTARRLSNASGYEMIPVRADSARSTRTPEHHSLEEQIIASPDFGRRCVEEELGEPVLTRIPNSIATQLEKQVATAIGLRGRARLVPRLPRSVVSCKHGSDCCWRWLARAALEEIWGSSLATLSLAECVKKMKEEFAQLQADRRDFEAEQFRAKAAEETAARLQEELTECKVDGREFRVLEREHGRVQNETIELRTLAGKLDAQLELQRKQWHQEKEVMIQQATAETEQLRSRAESAETSAVQAQAVENDLRERVKELQQQVRELKSELQEDRNMKLKLMKKPGKKKPSAKRSASRRKSKSRSGTSPSKSRSKSRRRRG